jgi:hypothetical protein
MPKKETKAPLNYVVESIDSSLLEVPRSDYQKPLNEKRVAQIVAAFDENIANEPKVSYRDGHYYVFDGQHTVAARIMLNGGKKLRIRCKVYRNLSPEQEALLFAAQTGFAAKPTPGNRLRARLFANDKEAIAFRDATENCGFLLDVDGSRSDYHINCINTAMKMYRKLSPEQYREALDILRASWDGKADSLRNEVVVSICEFVRVYDGMYNRNTLIDALRRCDPNSISRYVKSDFEHPGYRKFVASIFEIYNKYCGPRKLAVQF